MSSLHRSPSSSAKPLIGITVGDPSGIGPEISLKAALSERVLKVCCPVLIGDLPHLKECATRLGLPSNFNTFPDSAPLSDTEVSVCNVANLPYPVKLGEIDAQSGRAAGQYIEKAVALCLEGKLDGITTAPINKEALHLGGYDFPGHTEMLASLTNTSDFAMSFVAPKLRVALLTTHLPLAQIPSQVKKAPLERLIRLVDREMKRYGFERPRIALAAINPHAGEAGLFGNEEVTEMQPAVASCRAENIEVSGPHSGDTIFVRAASGEFDIVISCYHDQGLIPIKCYSFGEAVNVTMGIPFIRTSVDHGTAFDIAGQGKANCSSMMSAIELAAELALATKRR